MKKRIIALLMSAVLCFSLTGVAKAEVEFIPDGGGNGTQMGGNVDSTETNSPSDDGNQGGSPPPPPPAPAPAPAPSGGSYDDNYYEEPSTSGASFEVSTGSGESTGGFWTTDKPNAKSGETVTVTASPNSGYTVGRVTVRNAAGRNITVESLGNNRYSFVMPAGRVSVSVTFTSTTPAPTASTSFSDVPSNAYYAAAVAWAVANGITNGMGDGTFGSDLPCTRGQVVTFLYRAAGSPSVSASNAFSDVSASAYYANAVAWAVANGITNGMGDGKFEPDSACTRAQMVTFLHRAKSSPAASASSAFPDVSANAWYADAVAWAAATGVTNGMGDGTFGSDLTCTRAQFVTFLYRDRA